MRASRVHTGRGILALAGTALAVGMVSQAPAGFTLEHETKAQGGYEAIVSFEPDWAFAEAAAADRRMFLPEDFELPELFDEPEPPADVSLFATSSFILGLPEFRELDAAQWSVEPLSAVLEDGTRLSSFDAGASVTLLATNVGTVRSLQIIVDPTEALPDEDGRPAELVLRVTGPGVPPASKIQTKPVDPKDTKALTPLFLNTVGPEDVPSSLIDPSQKDTAEFPLPPGEYRLGYQDGEKVFRLPLDELGLSESDIGNITLKHHFELIEIEPDDPDDDPEFERHEIILSIGGNAEDGYWLYAPRRHTLSDMSDSVFVSVSADEPSSMVDTRPAFPTLSPVSSEQPVWREVLHEYRDVYQRALPLPLGRRFVAYWEREGNVRNLEDPSDEEGLPRIVTIPLRGELTDLNVVLTPVLIGVNTSPIDPDHYADLTLDGVALPRTSWNGRTEHKPEIPVTLGSAPDDDQLTLEHFIPTDSPAVQDGGYADIQALGDLFLRYESYPRADSSGRLLLEVLESEVESQRVLTVGGLPSGTTSDDVLVLDVTFPRAPIELTAPHVFTGGDGNPAVAFEAEPGQTRYFITTRSAINNPPIAKEAEILPPLTPSDAPLRSIFVREPSMAAAIESLVVDHGPGTIEFTPRQAYNTFNGGQESPEAIRDALAYYVLNAPTRVPFPNVLLVGGGSLDRRNYLGNHSGAIIPGFIDPSAANPGGGLSIETPVDMPYGRLTEGDILLDAIVTRLPASTPAALQPIIERQAAYNEVVKDLSARDRYGVFLNDYDSQVMEDAALWPAMWEETGKPSIRIDFPSSSNGNAQRAELADAINDEEAGGAAVFLYTGHGNNDRWGSNGNLLRTSHVPNFTTAGRWPLMATFTCLSAYYAFPVNPTPSMAEAWIRRPGDGAIGTIAPATVDFYVEQKLLAIKWLEVVGSDPETRPDSWGEMFVLGANSYLSSFPGLRRSANNYHYFGDPSAHATLNEIPEETGVHGWLVW